MGFAVKTMDRLVENTISSENSPYAIRLMLRIQRPTITTDGAHTHDPIGTETPPRMHLVTHTLPFVIAAIRGMLHLAIGMTDRIIHHIVARGTSHDLAVMAFARARFRIVRAGGAEYVSTDDTFEALIYRRRFRNIESMLFDVMG